MIISGYSYLKLTAVVALVATALMPFVNPSMAKSQPPSAAAAAKTDLADEQRVIGKYFEDLVGYDQQTAELSKRAKLTSADLGPLQHKSDDLKGQLSGLQDSVREIVRKLKAANEWDNLDATIAARIVDQRTKVFIAQESFQQLLEESSTGLTTHANEISTPLESLRKKLTSRTSPYGDSNDLQIVGAAYEAPAPMAFVSLRCSIGKLRIGIKIKIGGHPTMEQINKVAGLCGQNGTVNPF